MVAQELRRFDGVNSGAAGTFVAPDSLDLPLTFEATRAAGAALDGFRRDGDIVRGGARGRP